MVEHANFRQILDSLSTAIIVLEHDLSVAYMNLAAEMLIGVSSRQVQNQNIDECFKEIDDNEAETFEQALLSNRYFTKRKARWLLHTNKEINVDYTVTPSPEMLKIVIEVQPLDRMLRISREEAMISSQETSRNLIRSMAHEIKNPLGGIRGAAQLLAREFDGSDLNEYTQVIIDETDRLRNLVDRMLGPRTPLQREQLNPHEVLERVISLINAQTNQSIDIVRDYDPSIPDIDGDKEQLIQATLNIFSNAVQALTEAQPAIAKPQIFVSTRVYRRFTIGRAHHPLVVRIAIEDNGPGIAENLIKDIFFPMITGRAEGSGLGLSISQNLIAQHDGLIECDSEPGSTKFVIYLPLDT